MSGTADGQGEYQSYPFTGNGSTGFPDAPAVLRSYLQHPALEILAIDQTEAMPETNTFFATVVGDTASWDIGIDRTDTIREATKLAATHDISDIDACDGVLLCRVGDEREADLVITNRGWLLTEREDPRRRLPPNLVSPAEALAIIGLCLRWHRHPVIIGGAPTSWHPTSMRRSAAYITMPAFERWNQAGRACYEATQADLTLENLNKTLLTRISRAFQFRDAIFALSATMTDYEPEEMLCELDSLLFSLVGAFDVAARIVDALMNFASKARSIGWQHRTNGGWQQRLEIPAKDLFDHTKEGSEIQLTFQVLRWLRNSVHDEALDLTRDNGVYYVVAEAGTQSDLREFLRTGHPGWTTSSLGIKIQPPGGVTRGKWLPGVGRYTVNAQRTGAPRPADPLDGSLVFDVRGLVNRLFPECLRSLDTIMKLAPLTQVPGYRPALDSPPRGGLPWNFSDTTGHRLRMLYGVTELP
ncbi:hypothetical protein ILP97_00275 [Amycolatopsis sp. H6(2020)]|nr:hypothetical protein [Amycolatopsis sp. H6(2020)]